MYQRFIAMGDSFTEGVGDELPDGRLRGWADLVALGLAAASAAPVSYANLAVRGRLLGPIVAEQLEPALVQAPDLLSICGGGNDMMRPRVEISRVVGLMSEVVEAGLAHGAHMLVLSGGNPSKQLPLGALMQRRGDQLADAARAAFTRPGVTLVENWADARLTDTRYWSADKLHLNASGHTLIASNVLTALGVPVPAEWSATDASGAPAAPAAQRMRTAAYYRGYVLPWIGRRLSGKSSGDGREPKIPLLTAVDPA
ncbi:SGNH/GDSL hydrolase family protein [Cryobacterium glucosi]|uniref:SGNH/GDSL hydrolase family protein n=2 Tax=Cryobacterium glucosi TaxID=1259175 RepID=A0ABY2ISF7_9MICO|nr:SGNH/GDSL hydrolase family protein [Cryobacterium glucosi]